MSRHPLKEGEATSSDFPFTQHEDSFFKNLIGKDEYEYRFTTEKGFEYSVILERGVGWGADTPQEVEEDLHLFFLRDEESLKKLKDLGVTDETILDMWICSFSIIEKGYKYTPNKGEFFKVMATVTKIVSEHMKKVKGSVLMFTPEDGRRARIFTQYVLTQNPNIKYFDGRGTFYFVF